MSAMTDAERPVLLDSAMNPATLEAVTRSSLTSLADGLAVGGDLVRKGVFPGRGRTIELWSALATVAAADLGVVRAMEPHLDAAAILHQAGMPVVDGSWGVFAAEGGDDPLLAIDVDGAWRLAGTKPWCSLAGALDSALVTATGPGGERLLFAVGLNDDGVEVFPGRWHSRGLAEIPSGPVRFRDVPATPVGDAGWYLTRPGFHWGAIGVAACWYGGAVGLARVLFSSARESDDPFLLMHLGAVHELLESSRLSLLAAASVVDAGGPARTIAKTTRATVARSVEEIILRAGHALGPAPLALDERHAKRVADLTVYLRQDHAERDLRSLGAALGESEASPW